MNTRSLAIRDLFLLVGLITTAYYCRTLRSTTSYKNTHHSFSTNCEPKLLIPLQKTIELIELIAAKTIEADQQETLESFYQEAITLQKIYIKTSPSLMLLGPIGAAATVLKENKICKKLIELLQEIIEYVEKNKNLEAYTLNKLLKILEDLHS